uniref:Retrotransposon gag domain-containing protein n=1 Tax=Anopheles darlingi TaxID=43151 RepID=A0A2M4CWF6_ANODA
MGLIPVFRGRADELDLFIRQVDRVRERNILDEDDLLDIVLTKLKGDHARKINRTTAKSWEEMKVLLVKEFGDHYSLESVFHKIETLAQRTNETLKKYKDRTRTMFEWIASFAPHSEQPYALRHLKHHFVAGLRDENLKTMALIQKSMDLESLMDYLEEVHDNADRVTDAARRLRINEYDSRPVVNEHLYVGACAHKPQDPRTGRWDQPWTQDPRYQDFGHAAQSYGCMNQGYSIPPWGYSPYGRDYGPPPLGGYDPRYPAPPCGYDPRYRDHGYRNHPWGYDPYYRDYGYREQHGSPEPRYRNHNHSAQPWEKEQRPRDQGYRDQPVGYDCPNQNFHSSNKHHTKPKQPRQNEHFDQEAQHEGNAQGNRNHENRSSNDRPQTSRPEQQNDNSKQKN